MLLWWKTLNSLHVQDRASIIAQLYEKDMVILENDPWTPVAFGELYVAEKRHYKSENGYLSDQIGPEPDSGTLKLMMLSLIKNFEEILFIVYTDTPENISAVDCSKNMIICTPLAKVEQILKWQNMIFGIMIK